MNPGPRAVAIVSDARQVCGVEDFARRLADALEPPAARSPLGFGGGPLAAALREADAAVINLPVVAWKRRLLEPLLAAARVRRAGRRLVIVLHEWADLDWRRRLSYAPLLPLADAIVFSAPEVRAQFEAAALSRLCAARRSLVPIPPALGTPLRTAPSPAAERLAAARREGALVIGQFGSIYPTKQSTRVLDVAAALRRRGVPVFAAFIGSFVKGTDRIEETFRARVDDLGLADRVLVTGFVEDPETLFGVFAEVDVFVYAFAEGLSARRTSVLTTAAAGRPVVVNAPARAGAFDHHPTYRGLIAQGALRLTAPDAGEEEIADAVLAARDAPPPRVAVDYARAWADAAAAIRAALAA